jgi:hypothetical protein
MLLDWGSWGYQIGAVGIVAFTLVFLVNVRWWTDWLGRVIALTLSSLSSVLIVTTLRQLHIDLPGGILWWRFFSFWLFGLGVWAGLGTFVWSQFLAPRIKLRPRLTTRREHRNAQADLADSGNSRNGRLHDDSGSTD